MFSYLAKRYILDYKNYQDLIVREKYGVLCSIVSIVANVILSFFKVLFGLVTNSISIISDGLNNFADVASNAAALISFWLSSKHPDHDHPYGHGRVEYIIGMFVGVFIMLMGLFMMKESVDKIINPVAMVFNYYACIVLIVSIVIKLYMGYLNKEIGIKIDSSILIAVSKDSYNDVVATSCALIALIVSPFTLLPIDGVLGLFVSIFIVKAGYEVFLDTLDPLLGKAPDKELIHQIESYIKCYDEVLGIHDLMLHDYGPGRRFMTLHVEVDSTLNMVEIHDVIDSIERKLLVEFHILTTIHMDPIEIHDENTNFLKNIANNVVKSINIMYTIHDFRIVVGVSHTNLVFDIVVPIDDEINHIFLKELVNERIQEIDNSYYTVIQIDHSYV